MNILVTGANGQLGNEIRRICKNSPHSFIFSDIAAREGCDTLPLDICDSAAVNFTVRDRRIGCIINCAAYTNVDRAETEEELCRVLNADAPGILAGAMRSVGGLLVHISTDYVFGADPYNVPCREDQQGHPVGVYGRTKAEGERIVRDAGCDYLILRTAWLYSEYGRNFVRTMLELISSLPVVKVVFDQCGTPTYALDLAEAIMEVVDDYCCEMAGGCAQNRPYSKCGTYHYSNEGVCSWYDFAKRIAALAGNTSCEILPCRSSEFPSPVVRPSYSVLDKSRVKEVFGLKIPYWVDSLEICIKNILDI